jgi:hypothetical protein
MALALSGCASRKLGARHPALCSRGAFSGTIYQSNKMTQGEQRIFEKEWNAIGNV